MMDVSNNTNKRIHFVRHAESVCNVLRRELQVHRHPNTPVIPDPGLTFEGMQQTSRLKDYLGLTLKPDIAICSPYTRTLHTCLLSYGSKNVVVSPLCGERVSSCDDLGLPASYLNVVFPMLDFSFLDEIWWYMSDDINNQCEAVSLIAQGKMKFETNEYLVARMEKFYDFLSKRPETNIVVFSHNDFLVKFLNKYFGFSDSHLDNCEVFSANI